MSIPEIDSNSKFAPMTLVLEPEPPSLWWLVAPPIGWIILIAYLLERYDLSKLQDRVTLLKPQNGIFNDTRATISHMPVFLKNIPEDYVGWYRNQFQSFKRYLQSNPTNIDKDDVERCKQWKKEIKSPSNLVALINDINRILEEMDAKKASQSTSKKVEDVIKKAEQQRVSYDLGLHVAPTRYEMINKTIEKTTAYLRIIEELNTENYEDIDLAVKEIKELVNAAINNKRLGKLEEAEHLAEISLEYAETILDEINPLRIDAMKHLVKKANEAQQMAGKAMELVAKIKDPDARNQALEKAKDAQLIAAGAVKEANEALAHAENASKMSDHREAKSELKASKINADLAKSYIKQAAVMSTIAFEVVVQETPDRKINGKKASALFGNLVRNVRSSVTCEIALEKAQYAKFIAAEALQQRS